MRIYITYRTSLIVINDSWRNQFYLRLSRDSRSISNCLTSASRNATARQQLLVPVITSKQRYSYRIYISSQRTNKTILRLLQKRCYNSVDRQTSACMLSFIYHKVRQKKSQIKHTIVECGQFRREICVFLHQIQ